MVRLMRLAAMVAVVLVSCGFANLNFREPFTDIYDLKAHLAPVQVLREGYYESVTAQAMIGGKPQRGLFRHNAAGGHYGYYVLEGESRVLFSRYWILKVEGLPKDMYLFQAQNVHRRGYFYGYMRLREGRLSTWIPPHGVPRQLSATYKQLFDDGVLTQPHRDLVPFLVKAWDWYSKHPAQWADNGMMLLAKPL